MNSIELFGVIFQRTGTKKLEFISSSKASYGDKIHRLLFSYYAVFRDRSDYVIFLDFKLTAKSLN